MADRSVRDGAWVRRQAGLHVRRSIVHGKQAGEQAHIFRMYRMQAGRCGRQECRVASRQTRMADGQDWVAQLTGRFGW